MLVQTKPILSRTLLINLSILLRRFGMVASFKYKLNIIVSIIWL